MPAEIIVNLMNDNEKFQSDVKSWETVHAIVEPSIITENMVDLKGYYEAILFSVFLSQQDFDK